MNGNETAIRSTSAQRLGDRATGVEQQLIDLVARRAGACLDDRPRIDAEIAALHDELATIAARVPAA
jgi:hypothetical protein